MSDDGLNELVEIAEILNTARTKWWVDSGTLLSLYRDGQLFAIDRDKDFDIGMLAESEMNLISVLPKFQQMGFRVGRRRFCGEVVKYWLKAPRGSGRKDLDIKLHRFINDDAVCPGAWVAIDGELVKVLQAPANLCKLGIGYAWRRRFRSSWRLPLLRVSFRVTSWVIPARFLNELTEVELAGHRFPVPTPVEDYLSYRYGDWRLPTSDWNTQRDDGGLRLTAPEGW